MPHLLNLLCSSGCSCAVEISHFSTYGVVDSGVAFSVSGSSSDVKSPTSNTTNVLSVSSTWLPASLVSGMLAAVATLMAFTEEF